MEWNPIMSKKWHVKADGSMGVCTAQEGHCPFSGETGTRHFSSEREAQAYSEERIKAINSGKSMGVFFRKKPTRAETPGGSSSVKQLRDMKMPYVEMRHYKINAPFGNAVIDRVEADRDGNCYVIMSPCSDVKDQIPASLDLGMRSIVNNWNYRFELYNGRKWRGRPYFDGEILMVNDSTGEAYKVDDFSLKGISASGKSVGNINELVDSPIPCVVTAVDRNHTSFGDAANKPADKVLPLDTCMDDWNPVPMVRDNLNEFGVEGTISLHPGFNSESPNFLQIELAHGQVKIDYDDEEHLSPEKVVQEVRRSYLRLDPNTLTEEERASVDLMGKALKNSNSYEGVDWSLDNQKDLDRLNELFEKNGVYGGYFDRNDPDFHWISDEVVKKGRSQVEDLTIKAWGDSYTEPTCIRFGNDWPEVEKLTGKLHISLPDVIYAD